MTLARAEDVWADRAAEPAAARAAPMLTFAAVLLGAALLPAVYGLAALHGQWAAMMQPQIIGHVALNCFANLLVVLSVLRLEGRLDRKLAEVFSRTLLVHGALTILILAFRRYYSGPMLLTGVAASVVLGVGAMYGRHLQARVRVGVMGPEHAAIAAGGVEWERIATPTASLRRYDLLLTTFVGETPREWSKLISRGLLAGKRVRHLSEYLEELRGVVAIEHFNLDHLPTGGAASYRARKRVLDILIVLATAPLTIPLLAMAGLCVLIGMGRPVFYTQARVGQGGSVFVMFKLRSMRPASACEAVGATIRDDRRITPLGRWLRRFRIDELPQLWNVLIGDMSLVGPRPEQPALAESYAREAPVFAYRQLVRPGITGWAQVRAGYAANLAESRVKLAYDLFYLKNFSFSLDLQILARTVWTIASGQGVR